MSYERLKCLWCGNDFYAKTRKAKFCSNACKQKDYRNRAKQKGEAKDLTLTFDEKAFVDAVSALDYTMSACIWDAINSGDLAFVKALYAVTRYSERFDNMLMSGLAVLFPDVMKKEKDILAGCLPF